MVHVHIVYWDAGPARASASVSPILPWTDSQDSDSRVYIARRPDGPVRWPRPDTVQQQAGAANWQHEVFLTGTARTRQCFRERICFFPPVLHFSPTLSRIFPNPNHIFPTLYIRMGPAICVHLGLISSPVGNCVFSLFCLKFLVPVLSSALCSNTTVQRIFRSGQSRVWRRYSFFSSAFSSFEPTK